MAKKTRFLLTVSSFVWFLAIGCGIFQLLEYEFQPGLAAAAPARMPVLEGIPGQRQKPTLVVVIHPRCPCSRATLTELDGLLSHHPDKVEAVCLFVWPVSQTLEWVQSDNWKQAEQIQGLRLVADFEGKQASQLGALTSGQTYLYAADGRLLFSGGLTGSRGHAGDNSAVALLGNLIDRPDRSKTALHANVYGCAAAPQRKENSLAGSCCPKK